MSIVDAQILCFWSLTINSYTSEFFMAGKGIGLCSLYVNKKNRRYTIKI